MRKINIKKTMKKGLSVLFVVVELGILKAQTNNTINLKQKLINADYKNINDYIANNPNNSDTSNNVETESYNDLTALPFYAETNSLLNIDANVNLYKGVNEVTIPLFSVQSGGIKLPVVLIYSSSGIKIDQRASEVGLGWYLLAAPQIERNINSVNDFDPIPDIVNGKLGGYFGRAYENSDIKRYYSYESNPDEYVANINGETKKFIFLNDAYNPTELTKTGIKIQALFDDFSYETSGRMNTDFKEFTITNSDGLVYDYTYAGVKTILMESYEMYNQMVGNKVEEYMVSDWKATKISDPLNNRKIEFEYVTSPVSQHFSSITENTTEMFSSQPLEQPEHYERDNTIYNLNNSNDRYPYYISEIETIISEKKYISKIKYDGGYISFGYIITSPQNSSNTQFVVDKIEQFDDNDHLIKSYEFAYSYFDCIETENNTVDPCEPRLKLSSLWESGIGKYEFSYNNLPLFSYTSNQYDSYGYHTDSLIGDNGNGLYFYPEQNEWSLLPFDIPISSVPLNDQGFKQKIKLFQNNGWSFLYYEMKVLPPSDYVYAGMLESIKFPIGGKQYFVYEPNSFQVFNNYEIQGAGLRIKETYFKDNEIIQKKIKYEYNDPVTNKSSGLLVSPPFFGYPREKFGIDTSVEEITEDNNYSAYFSLYDKNSFSSKNSRFNSVGYGTVRKKYEDGSMEEYVFKNKNDGYNLEDKHYSYSNFPSAYPEDYIYGEFKNKNSAALIAYKNFEQYGNGNLLSKSVYDKNGILKEKTTNNYRNTSSFTLESDNQYYTP